MTRIRKYQLFANLTIADAVSIALSKTVRIILKRKLRLYHG